MWRLENVNEEQSLWAGFLYARATIFENSVLTVEASCECKQYSVGQEIDGISETATAHREGELQTSQSFGLGCDDGPSIDPLHRHERVKWNLERIRLQCKSKKH